MHTEGHLRILARTKRFRRLLALRLTSQASDGVFQASLAFSVFFNPDVADNDPLSYALAVAVLIGPYSLLGPYVGVVLDRFSRRSLVAVVNVGRAALVIIVAGAIAGSWPMWIWVLGAMISIASNRFVLAGLTAAHPHVVEKPQLVTANSVASTAGAAVYGLGLATTGLVQLFGSGAAPYAVLAVVGACGYLLSGALTAKLFQPPELGPDESDIKHGSIVTEIAEISRGMVQGFRHLSQRQGPALIMAWQGLHRFLYGILFVVAVTMILVYFWDRSADPQASGPLSWLIVIAVLGNVGVVIAAFITPKATRSLGPHHWVTILLVLVSITVAGIAATMVHLSFAIAVLLVNIGSQGIKIVSDTSLQRGIDDAYRGRVFSLNDTVYNVSYLAGLFTGGLLVPRDGYAPGLVITIAVTWALAAGIYHLLARTRPPFSDGPAGATRSVETAPMRLFRATMSLEARIRPGQETTMTEPNSTGSSQPTRKFTPGEAGFYNPERSYQQYEDQRQQPPPRHRSTEPPGGRNQSNRVDAGKLWAGGIGTAVIAALVVLVGILLVRGVLQIPVLAPEEAGTYGSASTTSYAFGAFGIAILATGLLHMMIMFMPSPLSFFNWILGLITLVAALIPFTVNAEMESQIATASINLVTGICILSLLNTVASIATDDTQRGLCKSPLAGVIVGSFTSVNVTSCGLASRLLHKPLS